ncbi:uncharacterized protein LOC34621124 [Cyclospora cayetanensis]|uniref:Uncharacterized protein LOC34621124 n=2 Tax=Cyclospora cayetanensis TaxID=88456 RepID=A0A6P5WEB2_9EIME|nr:uncharacterized protein LOC34621124 [Cyclospora cayetanensis]OEH78296.1 hypothetical protein cyc_04617 [Cyclospora cayetanensis]
MNSSATPPPPPPGLGDPTGLRPSHASQVASPSSFDAVQLASFLPSDIASATALLQHYRLELQQQQQNSSATLSSLPFPPSSRSGLQSGCGRDLSAPEEVASEGAGLIDAELEAQILAEIASAACFNNKIDLSLLSFKQRLAFADLLRYKQCQLQQLSQHAGVLLQDIEKHRDGYLDTGRLFVLFPNAKSALCRKANGVGSGRSASGSHIAVPSSHVPWLSAFDSISDGSAPPHTPGGSSSRVGAPGSRSSPSATTAACLAAAAAAAAAEQEHEEEENGILPHVSQPFIRSTTRSRTTPALRRPPDMWMEKACGEHETYGTLPEGDLFKRCFSGSSSLADATATTAAETPAGNMEDRVREASEGNVSALSGDFALLHAQSNKGTHTPQKSVTGAEEQEEGSTRPHGTIESPPFFQRNMRRTTTMPNDRMTGKVLMLNHAHREAVQASGVGSHPDFSANPNSDTPGTWASTPSGRNGRCVRIDTSALAAARQDFSNLNSGNNAMAALLGDIKLLQEASASVQAATRSPQPGDPNAFFQRSNRRTTTLPGTMANVKIRATDVQRVLHTKGRCKPCAFYYNKRKGCRNGAECEFCHHEEHSKLTLKQWKKHQQRAHRSRLLEECEGTEASSIDFQSSGVLIEQNDASVIPAFTTGHIVTPASEVQHSMISGPFGLNTAALTAESLAHVREKLAELTSASEATLPTGG